MSSSPPEYQTLSQHDPDESFGSAKPGYPPTSSPPPEDHGAPSASGEGAGVRDDDGELITVTYTYEPRYPIRGDKQNALGVLYPNKLKTAAAVRRIFHPLQSFDLDRIEILAPVLVGMDVKWGVVMDEAWPRMISEVRPKRLKVHIADMPGDAEARSRRKRLMCVAWVVGSVVGSVVMLAFLVHLFK